MARPFQRSDNPDKDEKVQSKNLNLSSRSEEHQGKNSSSCCASNKKPDQNGQEKVSHTSSSSRSKKKSEHSPECCSSNKILDQNSAVVTNVYCISNANLINCGSAFISVVNDGLNKSCAIKSRSSKDLSETGRRIKVKKGIFTSSRTIGDEDIQIVSEIIQEDWKTLLKKLPGVTLNNLRFHQSFINAMDRGDTTNMAEIALCTWKKELPEFSTIANLSKTLFSIGYPDIVTCLKP